MYDINIREKVWVPRRPDKRSSTKLGKKTLNWSPKKLIKQMGVEYGQGGTKKEEKTERQTKKGNKRSFPHIGSEVVESKNFQSAIFDAERLTVKLIQYIQIKQKLDSLKKTFAENENVEEAHIIFMTDLNYNSKNFFGSETTTSQKLLKQRLERPSQVPKEFDTIIHRSS